MSYLPGHARRHLPPAEYDRIIAGLAALLADAQAAVAADRELLAARKAATPVEPALSLQFYKTPRHWQIRCASPLAHACLQLLQDLIALDEAWAEFAWYADLAQPISANWQEISQVAAYESHYRKWLDLLHRLRQESRVYLHKLRQAIQPQTETTQEEACPENGSAK